MSNAHALDRDEESKRSEVGIIPRTIDSSEAEEEVEVLSHAEQRKRRKLEKQKARAGESGTPLGEGAVNAIDGTIGKPESSKIAAESSTRPSRSSYGIWVGNLSFKTDADKLKEFFSACGTITRVNLPKGTKFQANKGFAYIDFDTRDALTKAVELSESHLDGRRLLIKDAHDYKGRPKNENVDAAAKALLGDVGDNAGNEDGQHSTAERGLSKTGRKILERQKNPPAPTLFIGNLGYETTVENIREAFEAHAEGRKKWEARKKHDKKDKKGKRRASDDENDTDSESGSAASDSDDEQDEKPVKSNALSNAGIRKVRIGTFEDSGKCKGWAFVDFHTTAQATQSLIDGHNHYLNGRTLNVEYASADAVRRGGGKMDEVSSGTSKTGKSTEGGATRSPHAGKRKRDYDSSQSNGFQDDGRKSAGAQDNEAPKQAFYRPPLALQPFEEVKVHKPNKAERQALRESRKIKEKRQKPGAALASAPRAKIAIQPSKGKKITFE